MVAGLIDPFGSRRKADLDVPRMIYLDKISNSYIDGNQGDDIRDVNTNVVNVKHIQEVDFEIENLVSDLN